MFSLQDSFDTNRSRWNAGYLHSMVIDSNLPNSTVSGQSLMYDGSKWSNNYPLGLQLNITPPIYDGQVITYNGSSSSWDNEYPRYLRNIPISSTPPLNTQVLSYDSVSGSWKPSNGIPGLAHFGNVAVVDIVGGNDSTASINGNPFLTIQGAINASVAGTTIWVMPGTYNLPAGITLKSNTSLRGISLQGVIIQMTGVVTDTTLITMGTSTRLEDVTLNLSSASDVNLTAIYFPGSTATTAKVRVCLINVNSTVPTLTKTICGMFSDGSTTNPNIVLSTNAVQRTTTNVTGNLTSGSGKIRGWYFTGALQFSVRDTVIFANGGVGSNTIGVETINTSSLIIIKTSTISGTYYDIRQPSGLTIQNSGIQLCATDLVNANADDNGFQSNIDTGHLIFSILGNIGNSTHYLLPGTSNYNSLSSVLVGIPFAQNIIIFSGILTAILPLAGTMSGTVTINLYNSTSPNSLSNPTPFATMIVNNASTSSIFTNKCSTFQRQTSFLHIEFISTGVGTSVNAILLNLSLY
jgi:hypothetical protein